MQGRGPRHGRCGARTATASWSAPGVGPVMAARRQLRRRGRRRAPGATRGPPGYGAVVIDPATGETLAEAAEYIGVATNNVAEYKGLIAGLRAAQAPGPGRRTGPGPDGLQAGRRADVGPLEDQAPGHEAARRGGRADPSRLPGHVRVDPARARTSTPTGSPTRRWTRASGASSGSRRASTADLDTPRTRPPASRRRAARRRGRRGAAPTAAATREAAGRAADPQAGWGAPPTWVRPPPSSCCGTARRPSPPRSASRAAAAATPSSRPTGRRQAAGAAAALAARGTVQDDRQLPAAPLPGDGGGRRRPGSAWRSASRRACARRTSAPGRG